MSLERNFQSHLIDILRELFPNCIILKNDPNYLQGFPDILILYKDKWAALEVKSNKDSLKRPNQKYYVDLCNTMSYANFIYPENEERVLNELQQALRPSRSTRISKRIEISLD